MNRIPNQIPDWIKEAMWPEKPMKIDYENVIEMEVSIVDNMICFQLGQDLFLQPADLALELCEHVLNLADSIILREKKNGLRQVS
jgi:hypothetical protein